MVGPNTTAKKDEFHCERSRFLDAFAALEKVLLANPAAAKDEAVAIALQELRSIRNDLVHSELRFVQWDGELQAVAVNAQHTNRPARPARILFLSDFKKLCSKVGQVKAATAKAAPNSQRGSTG